MPHARVPLLALWLTFAPGASAAQASGDQEALSPEMLVERIEAFLEPFEADGHLSGTLLVARDDEVVFHRAFGLANQEHGVANRTETRHGIASISKSMTKVIAIRLLERGEMGLQDPIGKWLPEFPRAGKITVEHLLRHRAGIPHRVTTMEQETRPRTAADMTALAGSLLSDESRFLCAPGTASNYSSAGYAVLARVLELASKSTYDQLLQTHVCTPAGMTRTLHTHGRRVLTDRAQCYLPGANGPANAPLADLSFLVGGGSIYSTAADLFAFMGAVRKGIYGPGSRASLLDATGIRVNGATSGFRAFCDYDAASGISIVVVANLPTGALDRVREMLPRIVQGEHFDIPEPLDLKPVYISSEELTHYEGTFSPRAGNTFDLRVEGGELWIGSYLLVPLGKDLFFSIQDYAEVRAVRDADGRVTKLDWNGTAMPRVDDQRSSS